MSEGIFCAFMPYLKAFFVRDLGRAQHCEGAFVGAMVGRSHSMPSRGLSSLDTGWNGNPFYSLKTQREFALQAHRPVDLPTDGESEREPLNDTFGVAGQSHQSSMLPTGKGRGSGATDGLLQKQPSVKGHGEMRTECRLPDDHLGIQTMGSVKTTIMGGDQHERVERVDGLQRALESELVDFLRTQNSMLMESNG